MGYLSLNSHNSHQIPRFSPEKIELIRVEKTDEHPVGEWLMGFFNFTFRIGEVGREESMSVPFEYDDNEWLLAAAGCATSFPIELRSDAMAIIQRHDPFSCP